MVAYDAEIPIEGNRSGLNDFTWEGVELSEAAVAARIEGNKATGIPPDWCRLHVFLPSGEPIVDVKTRSFADNDDSVNLP